MRRPLLWLALACHLFLATSYAVLTPSFEGPDENAHYQYAWHLANAGTLPVAPGHATGSTPGPLEEAVLAHHPPLYYALLAAGLVAMGATDTVFSTVPNPAFGHGSHLYWLHGGDELPPRARDQCVLTALRFASVLLGILSLLAVHRLALLACPERPQVADTAVLLVACLPMWSFQHAVLNSDNLATLLCSVTLLGLARVSVERELPWRRALPVGVLLGLAMLTKVTTAFLGVVAAAVFARAIARDRRAALPAAGALLVALALCAPILLRNAALYGDPLAMRAHDAAFTGIPPEYRWPWLWGGFLPQVFSSLLGRFGWFALPPHPALVSAGAALAAVSIGGLAAHRIGGHRRALPRPLPLLVGACVLVFGAAAWFNLSAPQPQGRLLFPAIGPAAVLAAAGLAQAGALLRLGRAARWLAIAPPAVAAGVLFGWFQPEFAVERAPAAPHHASLVGGIVGPVAAPGIEWLSPSADAQFATPPTLQWRDPGAPADARYSLYAFDAHGRVWLASHEWHYELRGREATLPAGAFAFLPTDRDVFLRLRRVPDWRAGERRESMPASAPLRVRRL